MNSGLIMADVSKGGTCSWGHLYASLLLFFTFVALYGLHEVGTYVLWTHL